MKSDTSSPKLPTGKAQWEKIIALAPGKDRLPTAAEKTSRKNAVSVAVKTLPLHNVMALAHQPVGETA